jgi:hypothetical protein
MAGAKKYQQVFGKYGFDHVIDCEALGVTAAPTTRQFTALKAFQMDGMDGA